MLAKFIGTVGTRFLMAAITLIIMLSITQLLGAEIKGEISLLMLNITLIIMINNFVGGPSLVYLIPRMNLLQIVVPAYLWSVLAAGGMTFMLSALGQVSAPYIPVVFIISLIQSFTTVNMMVLLGKERIATHNWLSLLQLFILSVTLLASIVGFNMYTPEGYIIGLYISNTFAFLTSLVAIIPYLKPSGFSGTTKVLRELFHYGFLVQLGSTAQLLNYRLSYYLLEFFASNESSGKILVGIYSTGVQLSESFWLITRSLSMVQYAHIANLKDEEASRQLTVELLKFSFLTVLFMLIPALLIPEEWYTWIVGDEFAQVKSVMYYLAPGILSFSVSGILSHYFAGVGWHRINTYASLIGLFVTVALGTILIREYQVAGAGITASIAYVVITTYQMIVFIRKTGSSWKTLVPTKQDFSELMQRLSSFIKKD